MRQEHGAWLESRLGPKIDRALELLGGSEALQREEIRAFSRRAARGAPDAPPYAVAVRFGFVRRPLFELELELPLMAFARLTAEDLAGLLRDKVLDEEPLFMAEAGLVDDEDAGPLVREMLDHVADRPVMSATHGWRWLDRKRRLYTFGLPHSRAVLGSRIGLPEGVFLSP